MSKQNEEHRCRWCNSFLPVQLYQIGECSSCLYFKEWIEGDVELAKKLVREVELNE